MLLWLLKSSKDCWRETKVNIRTPHKQSQQSGYKPAEAKPQQSSVFLWRDRQLRDYRKQHGLCYGCGEKYEPGHAEVCSKRAKPQANALVFNDLDREFNDEVLNQLAIEDTMHEEFCQ